MVANTLRCPPWLAPAYYTQLFAALAPALPDAARIAEHAYFTVRDTRDGSGRWLVSLECPVTDNPEDGTAVAAIIVDSASGLILTPDPAVPGR